MDGAVSLALHWSLENVRSSYTGQSAIPKALGVGKYL